MNDDREDSLFWFVLIVIALLCALCASCATPPPVPCSTTCGMRLLGPMPEPSPLNLGEPRWGCAELERTEAASLQAFQQVSDPRFAQACQSLDGWSVRVRAEPSWIDDQHGWIYGIAYCDLRSIWVGNTPPLAGSFVHEAAHAIQRCNPADHTGWEDAGIRAAIAQVHGLASADRARCYDQGGGYVGPLDGGVCR